MIYKLTNQVGLLLFLKTELWKPYRGFCFLLWQPQASWFGRNTERLSGAHPSALTQFFDPVVPSPLEGIQKIPSILKYFGQDSVFGWNAFVLPWALRYVLGTFLHSGKFPNRSRREKRCIRLPVLWALVKGWLAPCHEAECSCGWREWQRRLLTQGSQKTEMGRGQGQDTLQRTHSSDLLLSARFHIPVHLKCCH